MIQCRHLTEENSKMFSNWIGNRITYSSLKNFNLQNYSAETYSIKYVVDGTEHYSAGKKKLSLHAGNFMLVNNDQPLNISVQSKEPVNGFCIHLEKNMLEDVYSQSFFNEKELLDNPLSKQDIPLIEEVIYSEEQLSLGKTLKKIAKDYDHSTTSIDAYSADLYFTLSKYLLEAQNKFKYSDENEIKSTTRIELYRRLLIAREMMNNIDNPENININCIAKTAMLSASHLFRSFKQVFGISPYQYVLQRKLERSAELIIKGKSVTDVAHSTGFSDVASFSKAFKKCYGSSPMQWKKS